MPELGSGVQFECGNGGTITLLNESKPLSDLGMADGWAYYDDLYIDATANLTLDISGDADVTGTIDYINGHTVVKFGLTSREPNGTADIRVENLKPNSWYRLEFDGRPAKLAHGHAHGKTSQSGTLQFNGAYIPE